MGKNNFNQNMDTRYWHDRTIQGLRKQGKLKLVEVDILFKECFYG